MTISVADIEFQGPFRTPLEIESKSGVFVVLQEYADQYEVIDFGYTENLRLDLVDQDEYAQFTKQYPGLLLVGVHYIDAADKALAGSLVKTIEDWFETADPALAKQKQFA